MTDERLDKMMRAYCDPDTEQFVYKNKNTGLKRLSAIAAALVLVLLGTLIIPSLTASKHSFVLTVNAAANRTGDSQVGTVYSEYKVYDKDKNFIDSYKVMDAELMLNGEDIDDVSFRSLNGYGRFFVIHNPDFEDYRDDLAWWCDTNGEPDTFYNGWRTYDNEDDHYSVAEIDTTNDWSVPYRYCIQYTAIDDDDKFLQPEDATSDRNDIVEITVTFTDGETQTRRLSVTYPDGIMTVEEIG